MNTTKGYGQYLFLLGLLLAVITPFIMNYTEYVVYIAIAEIVIGVIVGLLNLQKKEEEPFFIAAIAFLITVDIFRAVLQTTGEYPIIGDFAFWLANALIVFGFMVASATVVVSTKKLIDFLRE